MAVFTIAGLTLKEAVRRRTLLGALALGLLVLGMSLLLSVIHYRMELQVAHGRRSPLWLAAQYPLATGFLLSLCLSAIKALSAVFAALLAGGAISGEIERGVLAVILPKPIPRWQILFGKWIGLNTVLVGSVLLWTGIVWVSFTLQTHNDMSALLVAACYLAIFPVVVCTLTLTLSTVAPRLFGTTLALTIGAFAWFDGILNRLGQQFDADVLRYIADFAGLVVPQGYIGYWVEHATENLIPMPPSAIGLSPRFLTDFGNRHLHIAHLDGIYVACYIGAVFLLGVALFQRRDV